MSKLVRILAPHFVAGLVLGGQCAPIIRYMHGWPPERIRAYCKGKGWTVEFTPEDSGSLPSPTQNGEE